MKPPKIDEQSADESHRGECFYEVARYLKRHGIKHDAYSKYGRFVDFILMCNKDGKALQPWVSLPEHMKRHLISWCSSRSSVERIDADSARDTASTFRHLVDIRPKLKGAEKSPKRPSEMKMKLYEAKTVDEAIRLRDEYFNAKMKSLESANELRNEGIRENINKGFANIQTLVSDPFAENAAVLVIDDLPDCLGRQTVAFRIHWKDGIRATLTALKRLLQEMAPKGTPGTNGLPDIEAGCGKHDNLKRVLRWLSIVDLVDAKHTPQYIQRRLGCDLKTINHARRNLEGWLQRQLGISSRKKGGSSSHAGK